MALALLLLAGVLFWLALRLRKTTGIPWVRIAASDTDGGRPLQHPLFTAQYGLTGKPDYLLEIGNALIPVEVKPDRQASQPYETDCMQVIAYCFLVEETTNHVPPYGLLRYAKASFRIPYTPDRRNHLLKVLEDMRSVHTQNDCARSHNNPRRCQSCGFVSECEDALLPEYR